jgi:hypothetical protein
MSRSNPVTIETLERHKDNPRAVLYCAGCGGSYSADPGDYFMQKPGQPLLCHCVRGKGRALRLIHREVLERELT